MGDPFIGELKLVSFNFPPKGWAFCNGQLLPINQNQPLFSLLGTTYGGNGQTTFALPDLRGRVPMHAGAGFGQGQVLGEEFHTITTSELPAHSHQLMGASALASAAVPSNGTWATVDVTTFGNLYGDPSNLVAMAPQALGNTGGSQPHENRQPFLVLNWIIALQGVFPSRN